MTLKNYNRRKEYKLKKEKHEMYIKKLNNTFQKRNILYKELEKIDDHDGTVESYKYNPKLNKVMARLSSLNGRIRYLTEKVERTE